MKDGIPILIADDHPIFRKGLREIIEADSSLQIVGEAEDGAKALELIRELRPQVVVLDVDMPNKDGFAVAREVKQAKLDVKLIFLTMHRDERFFNAALDLGVPGYVLKDSALDEIVKSIKAVAKGQSYVTPLLTDYLLKRHRGESEGNEASVLSSLTESERSVLRLVAQYKTSKEIADELFISPRTVERHRANIANKLEIKGSHAVLQFALEHKEEL
jgi:DNA-binding NarL/FixJ family response regulator